MSSQKKHIELVGVAYNLILYLQKRKSLNLLNYLKKLIKQRIWIVLSKRFGVTLMPSSNVI